MIIASILLLLLLLLIVSIPAFSLSKGNYHMYSYSGNVGEPLWLLQLIPELHYQRLQQEQRATAYGKNWLIISSHSCNSRRSGISSFLQQQRKNFLLHKQKYNDSCVCSIEPKKAGQQQRNEKFKQILPGSTRKKVGGTGSVTNV